MAPPTLDDARRAADEIVSAGVGTVLLFGSLARGEARTCSDIDLVAIYDDLGDYSERSRRKCALEARARAAAGCPVDVFVTDAAEWAVRTVKVPCSLEARIAGHAIELADMGEHVQIDWNKEIGLPANPTAELQQRFGNFSAAVSTLGQRLRPTEEEREADADDDLAELADQENLRFAPACGATHMIFEAAAKITFIITVGAPPEREHQIPALLEGQPVWVQQAFEDLAAGDVDLAQLHRWHQGVNYTDARPVTAFDESYLRRHAAAATRIAAFVGDQCRHQGLDPDVFRRFEHRLHRCTSALQAQVRLPPECPQ